MFLQLKLKEWIFILLCLAIIATASYNMTYEEDAAQVHDQEIRSDKESSERKESTE